MTATPPLTDPPPGTSSPRLGWLAIPAILLVMILVGIAVSAEPRDEFEEEAERRQSQEQPPQERQQNFEESGQPGGSEQDQDRDARQPGPPGQGLEDYEDQVTITTKNGEIVVTLDKDGKPVQLIPSDSLGPSDPERVLIPDADGELAGVRVTEDGRLEPVEREDLQSDGYLFRPSADFGLDIVRPDGSRINLAPTAQGELDAIEFGNDGPPQPIAADGGEIVIDTGAEFRERFGPDFKVDPTTEPIIVETESGWVRITLDRTTGDLLANQPDDNAVVELQPDELSAIRIDEHGQPEIVPLDEINPDEDTLLAPAEEGFDLLRPDGSRVEFRPDGDNDGITATEVTAEDQETELVPNPDGSITLQDGTTIGPIDIAEDGGIIENILDQGNDLPWPWVFAAIGLLALLSIGTATYLHRNRPQDQFNYVELANHGVPVARFEEFARMLAADPDPTRSIRLGFYAVERGMSGLPVRQSSETPFEWLGRVEKTRPDLAQVLGPICDLFALARFAPGQATDEDRDQMISLLRQMNNVANSAASDAKLARV